MTVVVRDAVRVDLGRVIAIERVSFSDPWTRGMFGSYLAGNDANAFLIAEDASEGAIEIVGYAITQSVADESELLNIAVDPEHRNRGIGAVLLDAAIERCARNGALEMWLEVRASNTSARTLYDTRGFAAVGIRKRYYHAPREDAIVLRTALHSAGNKMVTQEVAGFSAEPIVSILSPATHTTRQETK